MHRKPKLSQNRLRCLTGVLHRQAIYTKNPEIGLNTCITWRLVHAARQFLAGTQKL